MHGLKWPIISARIVRTDGMVCYSGTTYDACGYIIGHFQSCATDIYLHIDARMHGRLYPHAPVPPSLCNGYDMCKGLEDEDDVISVSRRLCDQCLSRMLGDISTTEVTNNDQCFLIVSLRVP